MFTLKLGCCAGGDQGRSVWGIGIMGGELMVDIYAFVLLQKLLILHLEQGISRAKRLKLCSHCSYCGYNVRLYWNSFYSHIQVCLGIFSVRF